MILVLGCVAGGYGAAGGHFAILWQPYEFVIILGSAVGAFILGNPGFVLKASLKHFGYLFKGNPYKKDDYLELMKFLFEMFKTVKSKGLLAIESDLDNPHESELFNNYPKVAKDHHAVDFFCDYMRIIIMGVDDYYQLDDLMAAELDAHHHDAANVNGAITTFADSTPALGIVAAVLGVIHTMGLISEPPDVLGHAIGAALVGTFFGILISYGILAPIATFCTKFSDAESHFLDCIKVAILANMKGNAPAISIEFTRKAIPQHLRPSFTELDEILNAE